MQSIIKIITLESEINYVDGGSYPKIHNFYETGLL